MIHLFSLLRNEKLGKIVQSFKFINQKNIHDENVLEENLKFETNIHQINHMKKINLNKKNYLPISVSITSLYKK